jgi:hypothetical protein
MREKTVIVAAQLWSLPVTSRPLPPLLILSNSNAGTLVDHREPPDQAVNTQLTLVEEVWENVRQLRQTRLWSEDSRRNREELRRACADTDETRPRHGTGKC